MNAHFVFNAFNARLGNREYKCVLLVCHHSEGVERCAHSVNLFVIIEFGQEIDGSEALVSERVEPSEGGIMNYFMSSFKDRQPGKARCPAQVNLAAVVGVE